jgi:hypothetical protein
METTLITLIVVVVLMVYVLRRKALPKLDEAACSVLDATINTVATVNVGATSFREYVESKALEQGTAMLAASVASANKRNALVATLPVGQKTVHEIYQQFYK